MIYLDYQATTPLDARVKAAMEPFLSAPNHPRFTGNALADARAMVAESLNAQPEEIIFTSGATEANNLALLGMAEWALQSESPKRHMVSVVTEHKAVLEPLRSLQQKGFRLTLLPVDAHGHVAVDAFRAALREDTLLVSIMAANNETGALHPVAEMAEICAERRIHFHADAAQAFGKTPLDMARMPISLLSLSAHKIYGPQGVGALFIRRKPRTPLIPLYTGGGQERGLRSGTVPVALAAGLGEAAGIAQAEMAGEAERLTALSNRLLQGLLAAVPDMVVNSPETRLAGNLHVSFRGIAQEALFNAVPDVVFSAGSACQAGSVSHVMQAIGRVGDYAHARLSVGRFTTEAEVDAAVAKITRAVRHLQQK